MDIQVWRHDDINREVKVQTNGTVQLPLAGAIKASGMSLTEFQSALTKGLSEYLRNPQVTVQVKNARSQKIYVLGEVNRPGVYLLDGPMTAMEAIGSAGGFNRDAKKQKVVLMRRQKDGQSKPIVLTSEAPGKNELALHNAYLQRGDVLYVSLSNVAMVDRFFNHLATVLNPIVTLETGIILYPEAEDVLSGKDSRSNFIVTP
ncbi:MAG: polysaccharide export protein [Proteobacteria bacterium]|nr:polysaccharide export protein [Pseudomonadota bacterium]